MVLLFSLQELLSCSFFVEMFDLKHEAWQVFSILSFLVIQLELKIMVMCTQGKFQIRLVNSKGCDYSLKFLNIYYTEINIEVGNQILTNNIGYGRLITSSILVTPLLKMAWINLIEKMSSFHD